MFFYADLHIHSKYSRATSKDCNLEQLALWAQKKGLSVISTGDFTHPAWFNEINEKLIPAGNGIYKLKPEIEKSFLKEGTPVRFILSVEISTIYKKGDKTRKVHHVVFCPNLETAQNFRNRLDAIGNIKSDGRPILGLDSRNLLETVLESGNNSYIIPAHIWTPWFSVLGSKSGFDSIEECYEDLSDHIFAVETGLSSDPMMNWKVSKLDKYRLVSNSDAHSPSKLAREATVFDTIPDYFSIMNALKTGEGYVGTVEFFPEEGKYHEDGHRKCNICLTPDETKKYNGICPVCGKPLTIGVLNRVCELADRDFSDTYMPKTGGKVFSLVPLTEIISEIMQVGSASKSVINEYEKLIKKYGSELDILQNIPPEEFSKENPLLTEALIRLRKGQVIKHAGFDGEYGVIRLFEDQEIKKKNFINLKLNIEIPQQIKQDPIKYEIKQKIINTVHDEYKHTTGFDEYQKAAITNPNNKLLIVAGPGSGKTTVLTNRIAYFVKEKNIPSDNCLAITFTRKAAQEMRERLNRLIPGNNVNIFTFHALCLNILKENNEKAGIAENFEVISEEEKKLYDELPANFIEFDDLITLTIQLFNNYPEIKELYRQKYKYVFVDEYQDIDENQYNFIKLLVPQNGNICVIGDPNQAIYGFRGGSCKFFNNFELDYPNTQKITLKNNYRSSSNIVNASNQMINSFNLTSSDTNIQDKITIYTAQSDKAEAEFVVSTIENMIGGHSFFSIDSERSNGEKNDLSFSDFAILYRTSAQLKPLIEALERSGMPYVKLSDDMLCNKKPIRDMLKNLTNDTPLQEQLNSVNCEDYILKYLKDLAKNCSSKNDFIHQVSLLKESDTIDSRADRISLMTLHSSKGLEFNCVFITGLETGILPIYKAETPEEIEEERRLLYVGMTRAKQKLFLSHSLKRVIFGEITHPEISPFLTKIKDELLTYSQSEKKFHQKEPVNQLSLF